MYERQNKEKKQKPSLKRFRYSDNIIPFTHSKHTFIIASILCYFDLKCYMCMKTNISRIFIHRILNQLISTNLSYCYLIVFFWEK